MILKAKKRTAWLGIISVILLILAIATWPGPGASTGTSQAHLNNFIGDLFELALLLTIISWTYNWWHARSKRGEQK